MSEFLYRNTKTTDFVKTLLVYLSFFCDLLQYAYENKDCQLKNTWYQLRTQVNGLFYTVLFYKEPI